MDDAIAPHSWQQTATKHGGTRRRHVYCTLRRLALHYGFKPGQHLDVVDISERLRVSNTPVREALIRLNGEGLVVAIPSRGFFARELQLREMIELHDLAHVLLADCVRRVERSLALIEQLTSHLAALVRPRRRASAVTLAKATEGIFEDVVAASGNAKMLCAIKRICEQTHHIRVCAFEHRRSRRTLRTELAGLIGALRDGDVEAALVSLDLYFRGMQNALPEIVAHALAAALGADSFLT